MPRTTSKLLSSVCLLLGVCLSQAQSAAAQGRIRSGVDLVHFAVAVTDRQGKPVTGLTADDFEVVERGTPQRIQFFTDGDAEGAPDLHLGLLLDASGSMEQDIRDVRTAAIKFLNFSETAQDVTLVDFDTEVRVTRYGLDDFPRLIERIRMRKPGGYTAFYDALGVYLRGASDQDGQKVLVVYTDGGDTRSTIRPGEVAELLKGSDITMYVLGYMQHQTSAARNSAMMELQRFTGMTGGRAFFPSSLRELDEMYERIQQEIASRYILGYVSSDPRTDGAWRPVEIRLKRRDLKGVKLRTRPGYFAGYAPGVVTAP